VRAFSILCARRWVFVPLSVYPDEKAEGLAGWRGQIMKTRKARGEHEFSLKVGSFEGSWFSQEFVSKLTFLSD
jgi:hypothetical protein